MSWILLALCPASMRLLTSDKQIRGLVVSLYRRSQSLAPPPPHTHRLPRSFFCMQLTVLHNRRTNSLQKLLTGVQDCHAVLNGKEMGNCNV